MRYTRSKTLAGGAVAEAGLIADLSMILSHKGPVTLLGRGSRNSRVRRKSSIRSHKTR